MPIRHYHHLSIDRESLHCSPTETFDRVSITKSDLSNPDFNLSTQTQLSNQLSTLR